MAEVHQEVLIDIDVQQNQADFAKLGNLNNTIGNIKAAQKQLNEDFKAGRVPIQQYNVEAAKLNTSLKVTQAQFSQVQRGITGLKSPFADLKNQIAASSQQVNIAGVSLSAFVNPVTATIAVLGGLFKAYASTTTGAKDLEFAQNQLNFQLGIIGERVARLISGGEDGEGAFSQLLNFFNKAEKGATLFWKSLGVDTGKEVSETAKQLAKDLERLQDLQRSKTVIQGDVEARKEENAQLQSEIDLTQDFNTKLEKQNQIVANLEANQADLNKVNDETLKLRQEIFAASDRDEQKEAARNEAQKTRDRDSARAERLIQAAVRARQNIEEAQRKARAGAAGEVNNPLIVTDEETVKALENLDTIALKNAELQGQMDADMVESTELQDEELKKQNEHFKQAATERGQLLQSIFAQSSAAFQEQMRLNDDFAKGILKGFLVSSLRALKTFLQFEIVGKSLASAESIATFGVLGVIKAAAITGILEAAFGAAENFLTGFATGGRVKDKDGIPIKRGNGDNRLVTVRTDEAILNPQQIQRLGGNRALAMAGVPGYDPNKTGFATGGFLGSAPLGLQNDLLLGRIFNAVNKLQIAVVIEDVERLNAQRAQIRERASL